MHAEWGWLAAGAACELDWWLYTVSWSPFPYTVSAQWPLRHTPAKKIKNKNKTHTNACSTSKYSIHTVHKTHTGTGPQSI